MEYGNILGLLLLITIIISIGLLINNIISYFFDRSQKVLLIRKSDVPLAWGLYFQDGASPSFEGIVDLHNKIMFYLVVILFGVTWIMLSIIWNFNKSSNKLVYRYLNHGKYVPIQNYSKFDNIILKSKISLRFYTTLSGNPMDNNNISPVKVYENAYSMKKDILKENKGKSGIYMLTNKLTNDIYIGQSGNLYIRFITYFNINYIKSKNSFVIGKAIMKYGYLNFSVTILEYCDKSNLNIREQYYFDKLNPQYNILKIAGSLRGFSFKHTEETKKLMSLKKIKENNFMFGKRHSKDTIELMRQKALGRKLSEETKLKMSTVKGTPVNIYEICSSNRFKLIGNFVSARRAGKFLNISWSTVLRYINSGKIFKERYKFSSK